MKCCKSMVVKCENVIRHTAIADHPGRPTELSRLPRGCCPHSVHEVVDIVLKAMVS